jgi:energy-coupling factor transporter transmembrane protein EcfT
VDTASPTHYRERLSVPIRWWAQGTMLVASLWLAVIVAVPGAVAWAVTGAAVALMAALFLTYGAALVSVEDGWFRAGRARVELRFVGEVVPLDAEATRLVAGRDADARAYLLLRPYRKKAVKVSLSDPADPTPYWLVSTRRPDALAAALTRAVESTT